jgi:hypothetical protein
MLYQNKSFTLPTINKQLTERQYDFATLPKAEFIAKYGYDAEGYPAADVTAVEATQQTAVHFHPTPPVKE